MKVLHIIDTLAVGGAEKLVVDLIKEQTGYGVESQIYILKNQDSFIMSKAKKLCKVWNPLKNMRNPMHILTISRILRREQFDCIHVHLFPAQLWSVLAVLLSHTRSPIITTEHSTHNRRRKSLIFKYIDRWMYSRFNLIIAISDGAKVALENWLKSSVEIITINNGVPLEKFAKITFSNASNRKIYKICSVGGLKTQKNHIEIIMAIRDINNIQLNIIGEGSLRGFLQDYIAVNDLQDKVVLHGIKENVQELLWDGDLYIQSSKYEGFGLAVVEAMAASLPIIATNVSGLSEIVGGYGILYESGNVNDLRDKIQLIMNDPIKSKTIADQCFQRSHDFSLRKTAKEYLNVYELVQTGIRQ